MRIWRGNELPGGPCSEGVIETAKPEGNATLKFLADALVSTNRFDGSTATEATALGVDCERLKQCVHASTGRSKATSLSDKSEDSSIGEASAAASALRPEPASASSSASSIFIRGMS